MLQEEDRKQIVEKFRKEILTNENCVNLKNFLVQKEFIFKTKIKETKTKNTFKITVYENLECLTYKEVFHCCEGENFNLTLKNCMLAMQEYFLNRYL